MLSGGRDSVCLLDVALALHGPRDLRALHVNYGLRAEATADEQHCVAVCGALGVELSVLRESRSPLKGAAPAGGSGNVQAWAREVRYREAGRIASEHDGLLATGHTASDQVETILYRLACSPGRRALLGMLASDGRLIRPLLGVTREQTAAYCEARSLNWREDASNEDEHYARSRVRHGLLESLRAVRRAATRLLTVSTPARVEGEAAVGEVLVTSEELQRRVAELGEEISRDYAGRSLLLVGVLKGAVFFLSDLMRFIDIPVEVDFMAVASYGSATDSSGVVRILKDLDAAIEDRDVLIVEDIVDYGLTLQYLLRKLGSRNPRTLEVCALLTKPERRNVDLPTRYVGFEIPDRFVVGYGLDYAERHRNLPFVAALEG